MPGCWDSASRSGKNSLNAAQGLVATGRGQSRPVAPWACRGRPSTAARGPRPGSSSPDAGPLPGRCPPQERERRASPCSSEPRFVDRSPGEVFAATLLDEEALPVLGTHDVPHPGRRTLGANRERRNQLQSSAATPRPSSLTTAPNQVWSWDITKLLGPQEVDLLLPLRACLDHLQPLRGGLDGGGPRERHPGGTLDRGDLQQTRRDARDPDASLRPRRADDERSAPPSFLRIWA